MKFAAQVFAGQNGSHSLLVAVPASAWPALRSLLDLSAMKHNGYLSCAFDPPRKPRTTGWKSQNHHLHGHLQQLARCYGTLSMEDMKQLMKWDCVDWPRKIVKVRGRAVEIPISESDADTTAESAAISWCHDRALDLNCVLTEE